MSAQEQHRWDEKYALQNVPAVVQPDPWLVEQARGMPAGRALDVACGLGHNAIWLAQQGWSVDAVDISPVGLALAGQFAELHGQQIRWTTADLDDWEPRRDFYDLVIVFRYLQRIDVPWRIQSTLRAGGRVIYETFTTAQLERRDSHIRNPSHTLGPHELPSLFPELTTLEYHEVELQDRTVARWVGCRNES